MIMNLCRSCKHYENEHVCENCRSINVLYEPCMGNMWISAKDRLPEMGQLVLCHCVCSYEILRFMNENSWLGERNADYMKGFVTHWMPLPEPPKDGE